jgi:hypothetical protein
MPQTGGKVYQKPSDAVQKAAVDALVAMGFEIKKSEPLYVEGFRRQSQDRGQRPPVGIWLEQIDSSRTKVLVNYAKYLGILPWPKTWNEEIFGELDYLLKKLDFDLKK